MAAFRPALGDHKLVNGTRLHVSIRTAELASFSLAYLFLIAIGGTRLNTGQGVDETLFILHQHTKL
jgi:hypothetical protein